MKHKASEINVYSEYMYLLIALFFVHIKNKTLINSEPHTAKIIDNQKETPKIL